MLLWERLDLCMDRRLTALTGGGGKTTLLYALAWEARRAGRTVIVTTTTHMRPHPRLHLTQSDHLETLRALLRRHGILLLGRPVPGNRLAGAGELAVCLQAADVVLVEADGSRGLPLKAPADHEPVLPPQTGAVIAVVGADCIGRSIRSVCHRPERVCALLDKPPEAVVTPEDAAVVLASPLGGRKGVPSRADFRCAVNKADLASQAAEAIQNGLLARGIPAAVTAFSEKERSGTCLF